MSKGKIIKKEHKKDWLLSLTIEIPKEEFNKKVDYLAKKYSKIVQIPGFRKGKAPVSVIMKKYGDSIEQEAFDELMEKTYKSALIEEKIIPVATGNIKDLNKDALLYTAEIEIIPKIEVERYKGIDIEYVPVKYDDNTLDVEIDNLRKRNGEFVPVERESSYGDLMIIDLKAYDENKKPVKELTMENYGITLGDGYVFHDVEEALIGMKAGQETNIQSVVPDYYKKQELVGKKIYFNVKVKELKTILLPNLDDEFAKDMGYKNLEELREYLNENIKNRMKEDERFKKESVLFDKIIEINPFGLPESIINEEALYFVKQYHKNEKDKKKQEELAKIYKPIAEKVIKRDFIVNKISEKEGIVAEQNEIDIEIKNYAERMKMDLEEAKKKMEEEKDLNYIKEKIKKEKTVQFLLENSNFIQKEEELPEKENEKLNPDMDKGKEVNKEENNV